MLDNTFDPTTLRDNEPYIGYAPRYQQKPIPEVLVREKSSIGFSSEWSKSDELNAAESVGRGLDYFYADTEWKLFVFMACTRVLYDFHADRIVSNLSDSSKNDRFYDEATFLILPRLKLRLESICSRIGLNYSEIVKTMNRSALSGFFDKAERIVPLEETLQRRCRPIAKQYDRLLGERGWRVTERSVEAFVRQFPVNLRLKVMDLIESGKLLGRGVTREAVDKITKQISAEFAKPLLICRFSPNSGNFVGMILEQERRDEYIEDGHRFARNLSELEIELGKNPDACVVFVDDQFATGGQAHAQILQWSGKDRDQWPGDIRGEQNIDHSTLGPNSVSCFTNNPVILAFAFGTEGGKERILDASASVGYNCLQVRYATELNFESPEIDEDLKDYLAEVGFELLKRIRFADAPVDSLQEASIRKDALGYGGYGSVMVTPFGAPSHTITALWCPGIFQEQPWVPLFLRRGYRKHLVFG